jgi:PEGA domain
VTVIRKRAIPGVLLAGLGSLALLAASPLHVPEGTPVRVKLQSALASQSAEVGARVDFKVAEPVEVDGVTAIPAGAVAWGAVQEVKKGRYIKFDIEALRLPNLQQVKLRTVAEKPENPEKDQIKTENKLDDDVGLEAGAEFLAYVDEDAEVNVPPPAAPPAEHPAPATSAPSAAPAVASSQPLVTVQCFSSPLGADILIDGDFVGDTPSILKVTPVHHQVIFQLQGYQTVSRSLDLTSDKSLQTLQVTLHKAQ